MLEAGFEHFVRRYSVKRGECMKTYRAILMITLAAFLASCTTTTSPRSPVSPQTDVRSPASQTPYSGSSPGDTPSSQEQSIDLSRNPKGQALTGQERSLPPTLPKAIGKFTSGLVSTSTPTKEAKPSSPDKEKQKIVFNFDKADVTEVTNQIFGDYLKFNYVLDPALQGRISLYLEGEFTKEELLQMITRVYEANNISIVPRKGLYYIQPIQRSSSSSLPLADSMTLKEEKGGTKPVVVIYRLANMDAKQAINLIQPFLSPGRPIKSDNMTNSIIFVENTENAQTIVEVLKALDINVLQELSMEIVPVQAMSPEDAAKSMDEMMNKMSLVKDSAVKNNLAYIPLRSFGGVLILAHTPELLKTAKQWLTALDVHGAETGEQIFVYFVQNGLAKDIADILNQLFGLKGGGGGRLEQQVVSARSPSSAWGRSPFGTSGAGGTTSGSTFGRGSFGSSSSSRSLGGSMGSSSTGGSLGSTGTGQSFASASGTRSTSGTSAGGVTTGASRGAGYAGGAAGSAAFGLSGEVIIIPDDVNNAIIVRANAQDYAKIKKTVETLDIIPRAVLIEVMIAEISLTKDLEYGIQWFFQNQKVERGNLAGSLEGSGLQSSTATALANIGALAATGGGSAISWVANSKDIGLLINLLSAKTDVRILSTPTILATDNKEASITVGGRQPVPTGTAIGAGNTSDAIISSIQYEETGIILNVTPHINAGGLVRLEVEQTIRNVDNPQVTVGNNNTAPSFTERNVKTTLLAQNGNTIVIGGIIQQNTSMGKSGVPFAEDIPLISSLFSSKKKNSKRTELIIAITPHLVSHRESESTQEFLDKLKDLRRRVERDRT